MKDIISHRDHCAEFFVTVSDAWSDATGQPHLKGLRLRAHLHPNARTHRSPMGRCFEVALPSGRFWTAFECRLENIEEIHFAEQLQENI